MPDQLPLDQGSSSQGLDRALFAIVVVILLGIALTMAVTYAAQYGQIREFTVRYVGPSADPAFALAALEFAQASLLRVANFFLSFVLIFIGALYVLRTAQASYSASVEGAGLKTAISATSPGLILATLGVILIIISTLKIRRPELHIIFPGFAFGDPCAARRISGYPSRTLAYVAQPSNALSISWKRLGLPGVWLLEH